MNLYFAMTGLPASGKETLKDFLFESAQEKGFSTIHISFTDVLRDECSSRGMICNRENYTNIANALRATHGSDVLAERIVEKVRSCEKDTKEKLFFVLEAIRNPRESHLFRERLGDNYYLIALTAPRSELIERIRIRKRLDEQPGVFNSTQQAEKLLDREFGVGQPETGLQVGKCIQEADLKVDNSGDLAHLKAQAREVLDSVLPTDGSLPLL